MAALAPVRENVRFASPIQGALWVPFGVAANQGEVMRLDTGTQQYVKAQANTLENSIIGGIVMTPTVQQGDHGYIAVPQATIFLGVTLAAVTYCLDWDVPGKIIPMADLRTGDWLSIIGVGNAADDTLPLSFDITRKQYQK